jgi:hypothetical protein
MMASGVPIGWEWNPRRGHRAIQDYDMPQRRLIHRTTMGAAVPA